VPAHPPEEEPESTPADPCFTTWASFEYLHWKIRDYALPPLVTTSDNLTFVNQIFPGALGAVGTTVLSPVDSGFPNLSGYRVTLGKWADPEQKSWAWECRAFMLERRTANFGVSSDANGNPYLARPYFDTSRNLQNASLVSFPGTTRGGILLNSSSRLWGGEANHIDIIYAGSCCRMTCLTGFRYLNLDENLNIAQRFDGTVATISAAAEDNFHTRNQFYGGQLGTRCEFRYGLFYADVQGKVAVGNVHKVLQVGGFSRLATDTASPSASAGFLALPSNSGRFAHDQIGFVPELELKGGAQIAPGLGFFVGYNLLYWSEVLRPGNQINTRIDGRQIPLTTLFQNVVESNQPVPLFNSSTFWTQGLSVGLELVF
jgi:hypothetical protein